MKRILKIFLTIIILLGLVAAVNAKEKPKQKENKKEEAKELSGISIVGNKETPKSLFIVPWKSSEIGVESGLSSSLLNEKLKTVDKEVFDRELDFYSITTVE